MLFASHPKNVWNIFAIAVFAGLANASLLCAPVIATQLIAELALTTRQTGLFFSIEFAGYCIAGFGGRWLLPHISWHRITLLAIVIVVITNACAVLLLHHWQPLLLLRLIGASASAMIGIIAMSSANRHPSAGRAYGIYILGQCITGVVGLALLPALFAHWGVRVYFVSMALLFCLAAFMVPLLHSGESIHAGTDAFSSHPSIMDGKDHTIRVVLRRAAVFLFYTGLSGIWTFSGALGQRAGISNLHGGVLLSLAALAGVLGSTCAAWYGGRQDGTGSGSTRIAVLVGYILLIAALLTMTAPFGTTYIVGIICFKFAWTFAVPFIFATVGRHDVDGKIIAEINLLAGLGLAVAPWIAGQIVAAGSLTLLLLSESALLLGSVASVLVLQGHEQATQKHQK